MSVIESCRYYDEELKYIIEGRDSFHQGRKLEDNPYNYENENSMYRLWSQGFQEAWEDHIQWKRVNFIVD